jgi:hypothetical protein
MNKFKKGDIVVCISQGSYSSDWRKGKMGKISEGPFVRDTSNGNAYRWDGGTSGIWDSSLRLATEEEIFAYATGCRNIEDIEHPSTIKTPNGLTLKIGEYYYTKDGSIEWVYDYVSDLNYSGNNTTVNSQGRFYNQNATIRKFNNNPNRAATKEEIHWIKCCIKADRFISKEEALKSFGGETKSEYFKCLNSNEPNNFTVGKIYYAPNLIFTSNGGFVYNKVSNYKQLYPNHFEFEPSTKEEFEKQSMKNISNIKIPQFKLKDIVDEIEGGNYYTEKGLKLSKDNISTPKFFPRKGDYIYCHTSLIMNFTGKVEATRGQVYLCEIDDHFTNNSKDKHHGLVGEGDKWFRFATKEELDYCIKEDRFVSKFKLEIENSKNPCAEINLDWNILNENIEIFKFGIKKGSLLNLEKKNLGKSKKMVKFDEQEFKNKPFNKQLNLKTNNKQLKTKVK